ncbi:hypothetical protein [Myxacorys almedinensis]|uniref:Uncharacterized protein n=1 Tax=Myxacorys almedinensis A TaxID=2690445 RepID=A0A8J7Z2C3_9CYAN|nr:hypothetical protein [Myxacorys almedinensis]NDJ18749.1 hypothetical protein [Myxacorys almedinensis A]
MITFLTFHVEKERGDAVNVVKQNAAPKNIYHQLIDLVFRSACLFHPKCKKVMLSDQTTTFDYLDRDIEVYRTKTDTDSIPLMLNRLLTQISYVRYNNSHSNLTFLDSDILINANLEAVFQQDFDIALTYRELEDMPINWGVMFISKKGQRKAIGFLEKVANIYREKYLTSNIFWCDQYALIDAIGREHFFKRQSNVLCVENTKILLVPCETYNFSPEPTLNSIVPELKNRKIIHFKGPRKQLMPIYWNTYLKARQHSSIAQSLRLWFNQTKLKLRLEQERFVPRVLFLSSNLRRNAKDILKPKSSV